MGKVIYFPFLPWLSCIFAPSSYMFQIVSDPDSWYSSCCQVLVMYFSFPSQPLEFLPTVLVISFFLLPQRMFVCFPFHKFWLQFPVLTVRHLTVPDHPSSFLTVAILVLNRPCVFLLSRPSALFAWSPFHPFWPYFCSRLSGKNLAMYFFFPARLLGVFVWSSLHACWLHYARMQVFFPNVSSQVLGSSCISPFLSNCRTSLYDFVFMHSAFFYPYCE